MRRTQAVLLSLFVSLAAVTPVHADIGPGPRPTPAPTCGSALPADMEKKKKKMAGDSCTLASGSKGSCTALRCVTDSGTSDLVCYSSTTGSTGCSFAGTAGSSAALGMLLLGFLSAGLLRRRSARS